MEKRTHFFIMHEYLLAYMMAQQTLQRDAVMINNGNWTEQVTLQINHITNWTVRELYLYYNHRLTIIQEISHINFTTLTMLNLTGNNLQSIEGLPNLHIPHIQFLFLYNNNITSVRVMRKAAWPALECLGMGGNCFGDGKSLAEGWPQLGELYVFSQWGEKDKVIEQGFPAKMEATSLKHLRVGERKFCFDRSLKRVFQERWPDVKIQ